jgi:hypothetical protein
VNAERRPEGRHPATETTLPASPEMVEELAYMAWRSSPNQRKARLLATRLADLTVGDLLAILEDIDRGRRLGERGLL